jgi:hypothetical protein
VESKLFSDAVARGIDEQRFDNIHHKYGAVASWAVWSRPDLKNMAKVGNLDVLDPQKNIELLGTLHTDLILIGLNGSRCMNGAAKLSNFHDKSAKGRDYKLRHAANGTALWGSYMTDIIKDLPILNSNEVWAYLRADEAIVKSSIESFRQEIAEIGAKSPRKV